MPEIKKIAAAILISTASFSASTAYAASVSPTAVQPSITSATPEFVYTYLLGEIAGQRGDVTLASQLFLDLAKKTRDVRLAERAARAAAYANQPAIALQASTLWVELDPDSLEAQQASSQLLVASGNFKQAKPHIEKLLTKPETRANGFLYLNTLLVNQKDKNEVLKAVQELAAPYPTLPEAQFAIAQAALIADKPAIANTALTTAEKLRPGWEAAALLQGQLIFRDSPEKAVTFYQDFLEKYPTANDVRMSYAKLLVNQKRFTEAKPEFVKLIDAAQGSPEISAVVGLLSLESNDFTGADKYFQQSIDNGFKEPEQLYIYLGRSSERQKNDAQALIWYDKIPAASERYLESRLSAANVIARTKNVDAAIAMLDEVNELTPEQQIIVIQTQANMLGQVKRNQESFDLMDKAVKSMPNSPELIYDYAMAAERLGKLDVMEAELRRVIRIKPDYAAAYNALGYSYADRNIKLDEAKSLVETALKLQPNDHYMLDSLGWVHYRMGNLTLAVENLRRAYSIQADPEIAAHLGEVLWKQGQQEEAKKVWGLALKDHPANDLLVATAKKFNS
ncbi:tetratricopeptide repeat protein [Methylotenera versatilis]|uniref:tetratricopeptide repeat protein n=1 Tax=Methylotenera versatilis TaxID=1055487 RepID=UPI000647ED76|nr:tetratricopeptide repeat protein [Methylotenera versatilis]